MIEANHVTKKHDLFSAYKLTQEDKEEIEKLAKDPRIGERVCYITFSVMVSLEFFMTVAYTLFE